MLKKNFLVVLSLIILILLSGCSSKPKTELQQYNELTNSLAYNALKTISKTTIDPSLALYDAVKPDSAEPINPSYVHALASTSFAIIGGSKWAIVEANLAMDAANEPLSQHVAYSVLSLALHNKGFMELGDDYALKAKSLEDGDMMLDKFDKNKLVISAILGINAVRRGEGEIAELHLQDIAERRKVEWLPVVAHGTAIMMKNPNLIGMANLTKLMSREDISLTARNKLAELRAATEQQLDDPDNLKLAAGEKIQKWTFESLKLVGEAGLTAITFALESLFLSGGPQL